jgi:hypothetical protein
MAEADHRELLEALAGIRGKFILSGYPSALYDGYAERHGWGRLSAYAAVLFRSGAAACDDLAGDELFHELIDRLAPVFEPLFDEHF